MMRQSQTSPGSVDPITTELVQARLSSIVREMRTIIIRTAYSRMIIEGHDFSSAVLTPQGDLVAASELEQPTHISALSWSARAVIAKYGDDIGPGDLYLHNDPYTGGSHLNDVGLFYPVFRGECPLAIIGVMAHWQDVGGMVPGSLSGSAKDIYQEGIRIPSLRIARRGVWLSEVLELLFANVRQPDDRRGDLSAMEGACRIAERRLHAMADRFGDATVPVAFEALLTRGEQRMREAIGRLPDGVYAYQTYLDNSGDSPEPLLLRLELTIAGDEIHADFTGSAPQVAGPANLGPAPATTATFTMTKALLDPSGPINAGAQRPLKVTAPLGSVVNARPPAACGAIGEVRRALESLVVGTLGMAIPERLVGDLKGASNITAISGRHPAQQGDFLFVEFPAGGTGGTSGADGNNTMRNFAEGDISSIQPIEALEASCPLRVERMTLREDGGGPGRHRGGLGLQREIRVLGDHAALSVLSDKNLIPPYGVRGGWTGAPNRFTVLRDGEELEPSDLPGKVTGFGLRAGDVVIERTAGGGGYGDPLERDAQAVVRDLRFGYVSATAAETTYGVALRDGDEDAEGTLALRARLRAQRVVVRTMLVDAEERAGSRLTLRIAPSTAQRLGIGDGGLVEVARDNGPSLLGWAHIAADVPDDACALAVSAASLLGLARDERIALRRVHEARSPK